MENKLKDPIAIEKKQNVRTIDYKKLNAFYEDFVPQKELSAEQKYFSSTFIPSKNHSNASTSTLPFETKPSVASMPSPNPMKLFLKKMENEFTKFATWKQNEFLKDQLLEAKLKHEIECCVLLSHECVNNNVQDEIEKTQRDFIEIQEEVRAQNQDLLITISELKAKLKNVEKVKRALFTTPRTVKYKFKDTTPIVSKNRFYVKTTQSKSSDTTLVVSKTKIAAVTPVVQIVLWIVDCGCSKHMTSDRTWLENFIEKFMRIFCFGNNHFAAITGYGDYVQGNITVYYVYFVDGLTHNLFIVGQLCGGDLEVAFRLKTCYVRNLEVDDLLTGARESNLYTISISDMAASSPVCLMSKATSIKSWLWHRRLSHLNFGIINDVTKHDRVDGLPKFKYSKDHLCSACEQGKSKKSSHPPKLVPSTHSKLELLYMDLCGPMRVASINGKKYILVIVDDYSRFTWLYFLHIKYETLEIIKKFITQVQLNYNAKVHKIRIDNNTIFKNATLKNHYEKLGIMQPFSTARTPQQNGIVKRHNHTLVEVARIMLIFS
ncbi:integrase, catalytic region, zinc finger, CCHC-type containing protein [Tanacetum coccineum]|uniref:Integrase, catalytic region, zinc finger, CCHC-type containing protein n=1 Tax=Tanacetum coccineum TaxID=301880 RepID=A0ABQ5HGE1_9ASTR